MHKASKPKTVRAIAEVLAVQTLTPHMRRITVGGPEVAKFVHTHGVDAPAAWVKVFLPSGEGRAYTIRRFDHQAGTLDLDFVLHGQVPSSGPASAWAYQAQIGERVGIAGPRSGGFLLPADARWALLAGDATALPGIQSIANGLPAGIKTEVCAEVRSAADQQHIESRADLRVAWIDEGEDPGVALCRVLLHRPLPEGLGYIWVAGEAGAVRILRNHYLLDRSLEPHQVSAKGYWRAGRVDYRDSE